LNDIVLFAHLGITEAEREVGQRIRIDLDLALDLSAAAGSDSLADTVSYEKVYRMVESVVQVSRHRLLEALAGDIIRRLFDEFPVSRIGIRVGKPNVPFAGSVGSAEVELVRER
jgi:dihydroneopterin aldolase